MFSIAAAPAKQSATDTISVLSGRLGSATLLEDRRAAILGLRSFAKDFPATVASNALRDLIGSLSKDGEDPDTVKLILETLLMLFNPNADSPEASDEIVLWLADEFTQRQENVTLLLDFLETAEFYSRLYSLQLLGAILSSRTDRTEECIFTAPLGISRLVLVLDDQRDAVRNEAISLLISLTPTSLDIQKLVAFENAFERILAIIEAEGSLNEGGQIVEDCLILLANLLRRNPSNQSLFRESGCIKRLTGLLHALSNEEEKESEISVWAEAQRNRNIYAFLAIVRLLLQPRSVGVLQNQKFLWEYGLCRDMLQLSFTSSVQMEIKAEALITCGDLIRNAATLQETFAQLTVSPIHQPVAPDSQQQQQKNGEGRVYVIDGLLELILNLQNNSAFDLRFAAGECLKSYFSNHLDVRLHFLSRAIDGYLGSGDESANVLTVLLRPDTNLSVTDPYRQWFAAVITFHLLYDNPMGKTKTLAVAEGDSSTGEEVVTSLQTITAHVITGINRGDDPRIIIGYLMLLTSWLFEEPDAVNDFLSEGSNVQSLIQVVSQPSIICGEIVQGLCAMLLGIAYEFSTKDSPISRTALHSMLTSRLDKERYVDRLIKLRSHPALRDFETTLQRQDPSSNNGLADVFFDSIFVDFFKDNYSRISRAIDRSPELEISFITNGVQKGISRELVDSLREQLKEKDESIEAIKNTATTLETNLSEQKAEHRRALDEVAQTLNKNKRDHQLLLDSHATEINVLKRQQESRDAEMEARISAVRVELSVKEKDHNKEVEKITALGKAEAEQAQRRSNAQAADLKATISGLEVDLMKSIKEKEQGLQLQSQQLANKEKELKDLHAQQANLLTSHATASKNTETEISELKSKLENITKEVEVLQTSKTECQRRESEAIEAKQAVQSELDDLLIVFADLEDQVAKQKSRLKELGEVVSEAEDEDDSDDEDVD